MNKIWTVVKFEVIRQLKKPSFWIALFLLPVVIIGFIGLSSLSNSSFGNDISKNNKTANENTFGITDKAGVINEAALTEKVSKIETKEEGIEKVKNGKIKEYYYIPEDFFESKKVEGYNVSTDGGSLFVQSVGNITSLLTASAMMRVNPIDASILTNQIKVENTTFDENGEKANLLGKAMIPIAVLAIYYILVCVFGNRMLLAVVEEKENRISEMILTAVSAKELIIGKIIALIVLGFLQMAVFIVPIIIFTFDKITVFMKKNGNIDPIITIEIYCEASLAVGIIDPTKTEKPANKKYEKIKSAIFIINEIGSNSIIPTTFDTIGLS